MKRYPQGASTVLFISHENHSRFRLFNRPSVLQIEFIVGVVVVLTMTNDACTDHPVGDNEKHLG